MEAGGSKGGAKTRHQSGTKLGELVGPGKELNMSEVPTLRAIIQKGILVKEQMMNDMGTSKKNIPVNDIVKELVPVIMAQWQKSNARFCPPVTIKPRSLEIRLERLWRKVEEVAQGNSSKVEKGKMLDLLDKLVDITTCPHTILLCTEEGSGCPGEKECKVGAHTNCDCARECKVPVLDLQWLAVQRAKKGEKSNMMMAGADKEETDKQTKTAKRKAQEEEAEVKRKKKVEREKEILLVEVAEEELQDLEEGVEVEEQEFIPPPAMVKEQVEEARKLVDSLLEEKLGKDASLVVRYLERPQPQRNTMPVLETARASLRWATYRMFFYWSPKIRPYSKIGIWDGRIKPDFWGTVQKTTLYYLA